MNDGLEGKRERPWWVKIILWGLGSRTSAMACAWFCMGIAIACVAYASAAGDRRFLVGGIMALGTLGYYHSARWVDRNGSWS